MDDTAGRALRVAVLESRSTMAKAARLLEEFADALDSKAIAVPLPSAVLLDGLQQRERVRTRWHKHAPSQGAAPKRS